MKKIFLLLFTITTAMVMAQESPVLTGFKGSYAIYEDNRYEDPVYIGLCYVGEDSIIMRSYEPATGNDFAAKGTLKNIDGVLDYDPTMLLLKGELKSSDAVDRLLPLVLSMANTWFNIKDSIGTSTQFKGSSDLSFSFWVPVFQLSSIGLENKGIRLITTGIAHSERDPAFMDFKGLPKTDYSPSFTIEKGESLEAQIDGITIPLDDNWKKVSDTHYAMNQFSDEDATFMIDTIRPADSGISSSTMLVLLHMLPEEDERLFAQGSEVFITDGIFNLVKRVYDEKTRRIYVHQMQFLPRGNGYVSIAELSVLESLYLKNKSYFNSILY